MNNFYNYTVNFDELLDSEGKGIVGDILVVYISGYGLDSLSFLENVKSAFVRNSFCKNMILISAEYNYEFINDGVISNPKEIVRIKEAINSLQQLNIYGFFVGSTGAVTSRECLDDPSLKIENISGLYDEVIDRGIFNIISNRNLIMESSENYHFVKPSGKHSNKFIKVTNILENSSEISFLSMNLLKYTSESIDKIYVDTAGILPIAYELTLIKSRFSGSADNYSFVDTYGSYERVDDYPFRGSSNTVVIISASTSEDLKTRLKSINALNQSRIISLFTHGLNLKSDVLVSLSDFQGKYTSESLSDIRTYKAHECVLCLQEKSVPLSLTKSQFLFEAPSSQVYLPLAVDSDAHLRGLIKKYKNSEALRCFHDGLSGNTDPVPDFFIDVSSLIKDNDAYKDKVKHAICRNFTITSNYIVHCNDIGAEELALYIKNEVSLLGAEVQVVSSNKLSDLMSSGDITSDDVDGVMVVAASIQTGKSLLDISRLLRNFNEVPITYLVGFVKYNDEASYAKLKMDLRFCKNQYGFHDFVEIEKIMLPLNEFRDTYYTKELKFWSSFSIDEPEVRNRVEYLRQVTSTDKKGACRKLFLASPKGEDFSLGKTFAFWNEVDSSNGFSDQAPVYFTISSILQKLRYETSGKAPLRRGYIIRQLDPLLFDRFNEGIIQASVIRASKPRELDYSASDESSKIIGTLLHRMIKFPKENFSEALPEFLLALCLNHLQIKKDHIRFLDSCDLNSLKEFPLLNIMISYIRKSMFDRLDAVEVEEIPL